MSTRHLHLVPATTPLHVSPEGMGALIAALGLLPRSRRNRDGDDPTEMVAVTCWCERTTVKVPVADVRDGIGAVCDHCA